MPKALSSVKLKSSLMSVVAVEGSISNRSAAEKIEYWAELGCKISKTIDADAVFSALYQERDSGALSEAIASGLVRYQASITHHGLLEACYPDGSKNQWGQTRLIFL